MSRGGSSHIALSYETAKAGFEYAEVTSFFRKSTLIENLGVKPRYGRSSRKALQKSNHSESVTPLLGRNCSHRQVRRLGALPTRPLPVSRM